MGEDFFQSFAEARQVFERASKATGLDIAELCFTENEKLDLTEYTQPCILTCEIAMLESLRAHFDLSFAATAGHSLGEYTALVAANVLPLESAVQIVRQRGLLMQKAVPPGEGKMAALKLSGVIERPEVFQVCEASAVDLANINSPDQVVISGPASGVEGAVEKLTALIEGLEAIFLTVSAPFHSRLMAGILPDFRAVLAEHQSAFDLKEAPRVLSNFTGTFHDSATLIDSLVQQISGSVRWVDNMQCLKAAGYGVIEIGPNRPLGAFFRSMGVEVRSILSVRTAEKALK
ncbi:MAG: ACP S-malonyltransferase [Spirochaetales bacterium]|nr:ACP S-malonyltransferase [Spirochaetales bacterium]